MNLLFDLHIRLSDLGCVPSRPRIPSRDNSHVYILFILIIHIFILIIYLLYTEYISMSTNDKD